MPTIIDLQRIDESGIFSLPEGLSFDDVEAVLLNGSPVKEEKYAVVANRTAIDVFESDALSTVSVILY